MEIKHFEKIKQWNQTGQTGGQLYSDTSPYYGECSIAMGLPQ